MGWYSNGWGDREVQWWKGSHYGRNKAMQKKAWGSWKCECGNVQSGSQCKGCGKKWWATQWEQPSRWANGPPAWLGKQQKHETHWGKGTQPSEAILNFLEQFISQSAENEDMGNLKAKAAALQGELQAGEPKSSRTSQLRSVIDKLEHKKGAVCSLRAKVAELSEHLRQVEEQLEVLTGEVAGLEEKRAKLCESVAAEPDSDGDEAQNPQGEEEYPPPGTHPLPCAEKVPDKGKGKGKSVFRTKVKAWTLLSGLNEDELNEMLEGTRAELKRRRTGAYEEPHMDEEDPDFGQDSQSSQDDD